MKDRFRNFMTAQDEHKKRIRNGWLLAIFITVALVAVAWLLVSYLAQQPNDVQSMAQAGISTVSPPPLHAPQPQPSPTPQPGPSAPVRTQPGTQPGKASSKDANSLQASAPSAQPKLLVKGDAEASSWVSSKPVQPQNMPDFAKHIEALLPGMVCIAPHEPLPFFMQQDDQTFSGIILKDGYILANAHWITQDEAWITDQNGDTLPAKVQGVDRPSGLALLKLEAADFLDDVPFEMSQKDEDIALGREVMVLSTYGGGYVSKGIITQACTNAFIGEDESSIYHTDIALDEQHAGGVVFSEDGRIFGVVVQFGQTYEIMGCAYVKTVVRQLMEKGVVERMGIGVNGVYLDEAEAQELDLHQGIYVTEAISGGPARRAGLRAGDIITHMANEEVESYAHIQKSVEQFGEKVIPMVFMRNGCEVDMEARPLDLTPVLTN